MAITSTRQTLITFAGSLGDQSIPLEDAANGNSPGSIEIRNLDIGDNVIPIPSVAALPTSVTLVPEADPTVFAYTLKGDAGDVGLPISVFNPMTLSFALEPIAFIIHVAQLDELTHPLGTIRLIWA